MRLIDSTRTVTRTALRIAGGAVGGLGFALVSACAMTPGEDAICTDPGPNTPGWPYCASADPGGHTPGDDPIDPTGRGVPN